MSDQRSTIRVTINARSGVAVDFIKLEDVAIRGNGHMMMLEKNNHEIAQVMLDWLEKSVK